MAAEALELLLEQGKSYDLILLDIKMPDISGMEVLRKLEGSR